MRHVLHIPSTEACSFFEDRTLLVWVIDANLISIIWLIVKQPYDWNKLSWIHLFYRKINNFNYRCEYLHINNLPDRINCITKSDRRLFYWFLMHAKTYAFYRFSCLALSHCFMHMDRVVELLTIAWKICKQLLTRLIKINWLKKILMVEMEYQKIFWHSETSQTDVIRFWFHSFSLL